MPPDGRPYQFSLRSLLIGVSLAALLLGAGAGVFRACNVPEDDSIGPIHAVAFCPDGSQFVTANQDGAVRLWDAKTGKQLRSFGKQHPAVTAVAVSPDGRFIAATWNDGENGPYGIVMWDLVTGRELRKFLGHAQTVNDVSFTPDSRRVISASSDQTVRVWDQATGTQVLCLRGHGADVNSACASPDGRFILSAAGDYWGSQLHDPTLRLWSLIDGSQIRVFEGHTGAVNCAAFTPDGMFAASASWDGTIRIWDVDSAKQVRSFGESDFNALSIHPQGRLLISASGTFSNGRVQLWDLTTGEELTPFPWGTAANDVAFSPDGMTIASAHGYHAGRLARGFSLTGAESYVADGVVLLWNTDTGEKTLRVGEPDVNDPTVSAADSNPQ